MKDTDQRGLERRTVLRGAAWSAPILAMAAATPLAATSPDDKNNYDIVLTFQGGTAGSTTDITDAIIDWIVTQVRDLKHQIPEPKQDDYPRFGDWLTAWLAWQGLVNLGGWDATIAQFKRILEQAAAVGELAFSASISFPANLVATNQGPDAIEPGTVVTVTTIADSNILNAHLPQIGSINIVQTGGTALIEYLVPTLVAPGQQIFSQPLGYNPVAVELNVGGTSTSTSTISAELTPRDQDTDANDNGDYVTAPIGVTVNIVSGGIQELVDAWDDLSGQFNDLVEILDFVSQFIDWEDILGGLIPLP